MLVKAKKIFSDGIVSMEPGDKAVLKDDHAKKLILLGCVEIVPSHKDMKVKPSRAKVILKKDKDERIDKANDPESE